MVKLGISATLSVLAGIFLSVLERRMGFILQISPIQMFSFCIAVWKGVSRQPRNIQTIFMTNFKYLNSLLYRLRFHFYLWHSFNLSNIKNVSFKSDFSKNSGLFKISPLIRRPWIWSFKLWRFSNNLKKKVEISLSYRNERVMHDLLWP